MTVLFFPLTQDQVRAVRFPPSGSTLAVSENSHRFPLVNLLDGQATGPFLPWVGRVCQTAVVGLHGLLRPLVALAPSACRRLGTVWKTCRVVVTS